MLRYIYTHLFKPLSKNEDARRREFVLNILLSGSIVLAFIGTTILISDFFTLSSSEKTPSNITSFLVVFITFLMFCFLLFLSRKGFHNASSYILILLYFIPTSYTIYSFGVELPAALLVYALLIVMAGILISTRVAIILALGISAIILSYTYLEDIGLVSPDSSWHAEPFYFLDSIPLTVIILVITLVSWLSNREIEKSLARARRSERALKKERDLLEVRVEERTQELKKMQLNRIIQLERFAEFGRMASGVFHDLANPLTTVSLSLSQAEKPEQKHLDKANEHIKRAMTATKKMEAFMKAVQKQLKKSSQLENFSLNHEIEEVLRVADYRARKTKVSIIFKANREYTTFGNPLKFYQIVSNFIFNAIDACEDTKESKRKRITIELLKNNESIIFSVKDTGCGIPEADLNKIFDPFFTTKGTEKGTGLGLSTTKKIIEEDFHGHVSVKSSTQKGTIFKVEIPSDQKAQDKN